MSTRPVRHIPAIDRAKLLRIDHSDVYLTNDRLDEELSSQFDSILYKKCRQRIAMDSEILELRKACRPRASVLSRSSSMRARPQHTGDSKPTPGTNTTTKSKGTVFAAGTRVSNLTNTQSLGQSRASRTELSKKGIQRFTNQKNNKDDSEDSASGGARQLQNAGKQHPEASVILPTDGRNVAWGTSESDEESDSDISDDLSDISDDTSSSSTEEFDDNGNKRERNNILSRGQTKMKAEGKCVTNDKNKSLKWKDNQTGNTVDKTNVKCKGKTGEAKGNDELMENLAFLKLDSVPFQWFTSVVQARDSTLGRRPNTAKISGPFDSSQRSNVPASQRTSPRKDKSSQRGFHSHSRRPQTSIGIARTNLPTSPGSPNDDQNDIEPYHKSGNDQINDNFQQPSCQLTRSASFFERSRPKILGKSRRQLVEQAQTEAGENDYFAEKLRNDLKKHQEENAAEKVNLDLKVKDFLQSLKVMNKANRKRDILECLVHGLPLD